jgi:hypothetical protein
MAAPRRSLGQATRGIVAAPHHNASEELMEIPYVAYTTTEGEAAMITQVSIKNFKCLRDVS